jgi:hypothetical protein
MDWTDRRILQAAARERRIKADERVVANAITRRAPARDRKRSCGPALADARDWATASARRDREIVSSARLILVISKRQ